MPQTDDFIQLTHLCQGCFGLMDMPMVMEHAIQLAYAQTVPQSSGNPPDFEQFLAVLKQKGFYADDDLELIRTFSDFYHPQPYLSLAVEQIEVNITAFARQDIHHEHVRLAPDVTSAYHPHGRATAFTVYQFIYHEKNAYLNRPDLIWRRLMGMNFDFMPMPDPIKWFPVLIQLIGIRRTLDRSNPAYVNNIDCRPRLKPLELDERRKAFPSAVDYLINETIACLKSA